jgi:hypothetical protein
LFDMRATTRVLWVTLLLGAAGCRSGGGGAMGGEDAASPPQDSADVTAVTADAFQVIWPELPEAGVSADGPTMVTLTCEGLPSPPAGDCNYMMIGLVCPYAGDSGLVPCTCRAGWNCGADSACPATPPQTGDRCGTTPYITNIAACRYRDSGTKCSCRFDTSWRFYCHSWDCPDDVPTGRCTPVQREAGMCRYGQLGCACVMANDGSSRWTCDGKPTPDCPPQRPQGDDCAAFPVGATCRYPRSACVCYPGPPQTWGCG